MLGCAGSLTCADVLAAGWRHENREFTARDALTAFAGSAGLILLAESVLWPAQVPPVLAIAASAGTDLAAFAPGYVNAVRGREAPRTGTSRPG